MGVNTDAILAYGFVWDEEFSLDDESESYLDQIEAIAKRHGTVVGYHCSDECSMPYIAAEETRVCASRGHPEIISGLPDVEQFLNSRLVPALDEIRTVQQSADSGDWIEPKGPCWFLVSAWNCC